MMTIDIKINGEVVAQARARCVSGPTDELGDYEISYGERENPYTGAPAFHAHGRIEGHKRRQSAWALAVKLAEAAAAISVVGGLAAEQFRKDRA